MVGNIEIGVCFVDRVIYLVVSILLMSAGGLVGIGCGQFNILGCVQEIMVQSTYSKYVCNSSI